MATAVITLLQLAFFNQLFYDTGISTDCKKRLKSLYINAIPATVSSANEKPSNGH